MINEDLRVPFMYVQVNPLISGLTSVNYRALIMGQSSKTYSPVANNVVKRIFSLADVATYFGEASEIYHIAKGYFNNNKTIDLYAVAVNGAGSTGATGTIAIGGTANASGTLVFYIGGERIAIAVAKDMTNIQIADLLISNLPTDCLVTMTNNSGSVVCDTLVFGLSANDIPMLVNINPEDRMPDGITVAITPLAGATGNPDLTDALAVLGDTWYQFFICAYNDTTNITLVAAELESRFGYKRMMDAYYFTAKRGSVGALVAYGEAINERSVVVANTQGIRSSNQELLGALVGQIAAETEIDPAKPLQTVTLIGIIPPDDADAFTRDENELLLRAGISTYYSENNKVKIQRMITTYQSLNGFPDTSYLNLEACLTLLYIRYDFRAYISRKYPRAKLGNDGDVYNSDQVVMTPKLGKSEAIIRYGQWAKRALVEGVAEFTKSVVCERDINDPDKLLWTLPADLMNQFRIGIAEILFKN
jgi:phage tail sheath gpL-like